MCKSWLNSGGEKRLFLVMFPGNGMLIETGWRNAAADGVGDEIYPAEGRRRRRRRDGGTDEGAEGDREDREVGGRGK